MTSVNKGMLTIPKAKQDKLLQEKSAKSEQKREQILKEASTSIESFFKSRAEQKEKQAQANRYTQRTP
jgi:hypothetical protein